MVILTQANFYRNNFNRRPGTNIRERRYLSQRSGINDEDHPSVPGHGGAAYAA